MDTLLKDFFKLVIMTKLMTRGTLLEQDVCLWNSFHATCAENEVLQMEHALYGRMSIGRCIPKDVGYRMGCQEDVLSYMDSVCSGRRTCQLRLQDYLNIGHQPCPRGLESYLQLKYKCVPVQLSPNACSGDPLPVLAKEGMLATFITEQTEQGSQDCPWEIRGHQGQNIRLTLLDYGVWKRPILQEGEVGVQETSVRPPASSDICNIYARITEDPTKGSIVLCGGEAREKLIYLSETESVRIALTDPKNSQHSTYFLLRYEITGCPNYIPPDGAVMTRHEYGLSVACPNSDSEWRLSCDGMRWQATGNITNCTDTGQLSVSIGPLLESGITLPQGILLIFILSIAVLIAVIILMVGLVSLRRSQHTATRTLLNQRMKTSPPGYTCKEHVPMLTIQQREEQVRGYTSTDHRHLAVHPGAMAPHGVFPPLPLPPKPSYSEDEHCTVHPTSSNKRLPRDRNIATLKRPYTENIQESPKFLQHTRCKSETKDHFYYELDPEHTNFDIRLPPDQAVLDMETFPQDPPASHLPDVLSNSSFGPTND